MNTKNCSSRIRIRLAISAEEYLAYYQGSAHFVVARSEDNKTIHFPASAIRTFVTHDGIFGDFEITIDENNKLQLRRQLLVRVDLFVGISDCYPRPFLAESSRSTAKLMRGCY